MSFIYVIDLSTENKMQRQGIKFLQKSEKYLRLEKEKKCIFWLFHFSNS